MSSSLILPIDGASFLDLLLLDCLVDFLRQTCGYDDEVQENINQFLLRRHHGVFGFVHSFHLPGRSGVGLLLTLPPADGRCRFSKFREKILENFRELFGEKFLGAFQAVEHRIVPNVEPFGNLNIRQPCHAKISDFDCLRHNLNQAFKHSAEFRSICHEVFNKRCGVWQHIDPGLFVAILIGHGVVERASVPGSAERTGGTVHIAVEPLLFGADTLTVMLLFLPEGIDVAVVVIELLLGARDTLPCRAQIDVVLLVFACHKKFLRLSISRNGGIWSAAK
nr:MAG TPA: hypothetical protein [Caudoviricetes sp.]